jgi:hypothetical protein
MTLWTSLWETVRVPCDRAVAQIQKLLKTCWNIVGTICPGITPPDWGRMPVFRGFMEGRCGQVGETGYNRPMTVLLLCPFLRAVCPCAA